MTSMSYCRFENTLSDLQECKGALDDGVLKRLDELSEYERPCVKALIELCCEIAEEYGEDSEDDDGDW